MRLPEIHNTGKPEEPVLLKNVKHTVKDALEKVEENIKKEENEVRVISKKELKKFFRNEAERGIK